jgi:hypothetical protein
MTEIKGVHKVNRLAITVAVLTAALYAPAFSINSDATRCNNGAKLLLKEGSDSLFCTYDNDGTVEYSYSVGGESWSSPASVASGQDYPAIAADSTGRRWIIAHEPPDVMGYEHQYLYTGQDWSLMTQIYESQDPIGPASIAGGTSTVAHFIYAAFLVTDTAANPDAYYVVLTKHKLGDQSTVAACTLNVAYGPSHWLGDPAVAVEPYTADSNRVYVVWERDGTIYYSCCVDGRGSGIAASWTSNVGLSSSAMADHPSINAERGRVVVAWVQGTTGDIYARQRLSGTWGNPVMLSDNDLVVSDWPTVALGDAVVVAWEEWITAYDHDIFACIDYDDVNLLNIADNGSISSYPHVVLQPDGENLYLHTFWSEPDWAVDHDKLDIN